jgi:hypothetical protein
VAVIAQEPDNVVALTDLGVANDLQGHHAEAQAAYRRALVVAPEMTDVKVNLGLSLALSGSKDEAVRVLQEVATAPGATETLRKELAGAFAMAGDDAAARQVLRDTFVHPTPDSRPAYSGLPPHAPTDRIASIAVPSVASTQPDSLQVPVTIVSAPVVPVTRVSMGKPLDVARFAPLDPEALSSAVNAITPPVLTQAKIPPPITRGPNATTSITTPSTNDVPPAPTDTQGMSGTPAVITGTDTPTHPASETSPTAATQSKTPEGGAFVQLATLYSAKCSGAQS